MVQKKFIVPNLFTGLNFLLGVYAILLMTDALAAPVHGPAMMSTKPPIVLAAWILIWCNLLDKLDGFAARLLKASSEFGAQFDSMADLTAFGIAPGLLVYFYLQAADPAWFAAHRQLALISSCMYMLCTAMRLARFNAVDAAELKEYFHGLPSTFAGGFTALSVILVIKYGVADRFSNGLTVLPLILILMGLFMVSPFYLPKLLRRRNPVFNAFQIISIFSSYLCGFGMVFPEYLCAQAIVYAGVGFSYGFIRKGIIEGETPGAGNP